MARRVSNEESLCMAIEKIKYERPGEMEIVIDWLSQFVESAKDHLLRTNDKDEMVRKQGFLRSCVLIFETFRDSGERLSELRRIAKATEI